MQVCARCLYAANHPLHLTFDETGLCSGCRVHEEKDLLDWQERGRKLQVILEGYRNRSANNYDCIIPVSGARDSYFIAHTVKNVYGMNPLLVQELLGHATLEMTGRYTHLGLEAKRTALAQITAAESSGRGKERG